MKRVVEVVVDSNFLMLPMVRRINLRDELDRLLNVNYRLVAPRAVIEELNRLTSQGRPIEKRRARFALNLMRTWGVEVVESPSCVRVDDAILECALKRGCVVATNDVELKSRLRKLGVPVVYLRGGKRLALEGELGA